MPKLNSRGDVIMGVAGVQGSLNGRIYPFASYGRGCWRDYETILVSLVSAGGAVHAWHPTTDPTGAALEPVDPRAFNAIAGGGGRWVALVAGQAPVQFGSLGDHPGAGAGDVAIDGTIVYATDYFADTGLTVCAPGAAPVSLPHAYPLYYQALPGGRAIWPGGAHGRAVPRPHVAGAFNVRLATVLGEDWLLYWVEGLGFVLQPDGSAEGYLLPAPNAFDYDIAAVDGEVAVAIATTQGEGPSDVIAIRATRAGSRYSTGSGPELAWAPLPSAAPTPAAPAPIPAPPTPQPPAPVPTPSPTPPPVPPPKEPPVSDLNANPSYDEFINGPNSEAMQVRAAYMRKTGHEPAIPDYYHNAWRRLRERWTLRDIIHDILGEALEDGGAGGAGEPP